MRDSMTYKGSGVDYDAMDPFKRKCQMAARETAGNITRFGFTEAGFSRGESCYLVETPWGYLAHVEEGLGTKNMVADAVHQLLMAREVEDILETHFYGNVAQCTVAMIVNDMITLGALPISLAMHLAVGSSEWFSNELRLQSLINGWQHACNLSGAVWGGGETPTLPGLVNPDCPVLAGSAMGYIAPKERLITMQLKPGTVIVLLGSSGVHANGLTLCRKIGDKLPDGYATLLSDGIPYGEALLSPTAIYVGVIEQLLDAGIAIQYTANITGHGWRKLMRASDPLIYVIDAIPEPHPIFRFIAEQGPVDEREMYANFNMGAGFALYVDEADADRVLEIAKSCGISALKAGYVDTQGNARQVHIKPLDIIYDADEMNLKA